MIPPILFEVPATLQSQVMSGALRQVGALVLNPQTGRIVAHLQETGAARQLTTTLLNSGPLAISSVTSPVSAIGSIATYVQNRQILASLEALRGLQIGGLVLSGLGLGVSLAGFAVMSEKLNRLSDKLKTIDERLGQIENRIENLHSSAIQRDFESLRAACRQIDDAWEISDPIREWSDAARHLYSLEEHFFERARQLQDAPSFVVDRFENFIDAALLASAALVSVRTAMDDLAGAQTVAARASERLNMLTNQIGAHGLIMHRVKEEALLTLAEKVNAIARHRAYGFEHAAVFRNREDQASSALHVVAYLAREGYSGRAYLEALRSTKEAPIAIVTHDHS